MPATQFNETTRLCPGFVGVTAFTTAICQPSSLGDKLRFRGVDIRDLVGVRPYDDVWRLLVDDDPGAGTLAQIADTEVVAALDVSGNPRVSLQRMILRLGQGREMKVTQGGDAGALRDDLALLSMAYAVGLGVLLSSRADGANETPPMDLMSLSVAERLVLAWRGELEPAVVRVVDSMLSTVAEHGTTASTFGARVVASTGADAAACLSAGLSAIGGPRHGGATRGAMMLLRELSVDPAAAPSYVERLLAAGRRLPGMGHRVYREQDPRVPILRGLAESVDAPLIAAADAYQRAAEAALAARSADRRLPANPDLWLPVVLDGIGVPDDFMDAFLAGSRIAGWSAHSVEQVVTGGPLLRPDDIYSGRDARTLAKD
ncbi:citrate/2-methylcitrate synthase [Mycolicibacterium hippocampi]|uniref:citrate/2-methylcitrate synthase n=1 Tax=Mycolicibacterium hippocampi TaxID=659824 RepID=UPI001C49F058